MTKNQRETFKKIFFWFWVYTLIVILWGAWVRISHSGNGCGDHWPKCQGVLIPDLTHKKTFIEFFHRIMSGIYGIIVLALFWKLKNVTDSFIRKLNIGFLTLMMTEALLGAALVKFELVSTNDSFLRLIFMSLHQLNSFLLTGVTYLLYKSMNDDFQFEMTKKHLYFLLVPITGAIAALSTTLFPSISLLQGIIQDFQTDSHLFIRLRIVHPALALIIMGGFMTWLLIKNHIRFAFEIFLAICVGILTLVTLSPLPLKLTHLALAHILWARVLNFKWTTHLTQTIDKDT